MSLNSLNFNGARAVANSQSISTTNISRNKHINYMTTPSDSVTLSLKKFSKEDYENWDDAVINITRSRYEGLESTKDMSDCDRDDLISALGWDKECFLLMSTGVRPAMSTKNDPILSKINSSKFTVIPDKTAQCNSTFIINNDALKKNIEENKEFYTKRLNLESNVSTDEIFQILANEEDSPLNTFSRSDCQDIIGVMFGYPIKDCLIFQLERDSGVNVNLRDDVPKYKDALKKHLNSEDFRYKSFGENFKKELEQSINSIKTIEVSTKKNNYPDGYTYIDFTNDPKDAYRFSSDIRTATKELEDLHEQKKERERIQMEEELKNFKSPWDDLMNQIFGS